MVKAVLPEAQFKGVYCGTTAQGELKSRVGMMRNVTGPFLMSAIPSHPQSSGRNGRTGHLNTTELNHVEMQDRLSWWVGSVHPPVWRRSLHNTQRVPVMG